jgi:2-polyprenyl-3-methyl-5-hydroxy-6-metoxy-1,4-benzoquinol methylase
MNLKELLSAKNYEIGLEIKKWLETKDKFEIKNEVILLNVSEEYTKNFSIQWNIFQITQFDSYTKLPLTENRLKECSEWDLDKLKDKKVLEIGSGAGRFTEIFLKYGAQVVTIDLSDAIFANCKNNQNRNAIFLKGSFDDLKGLEGLFDYVFCYGVAQHTSKPSDIYNACSLMAKENGLISIDQYIKIFYPSPFYHPKYFWRPITTRLDPKTLLRIIKFYIPWYIKFDTFLIKLIGRRVSGLIRGCIPIPCWNYYGVEYINQDSSNLIEWAIMDTFDALGAKYDYPVSVKTVNKFAQLLNLKSYNVKKAGNGVVFNAIK